MTELLNVYIPCPKSLNVEEFDNSICLSPDRPNIFILTNWTMIFISTDEGLAQTKTKLRQALKIQMLKIAMY